MLKNKVIHPVIAALLLGLISGCASTQSILETDADPLEPYNRAMFKVNDKIDSAVIKPVAKGYKAVVPDPVDKGISNMFSNIGDVGVVLNDLLQFKFKQAAMDTSRLVFNTTFGLGGLIDVASGMNLPKHNEDFGQTLGYWGVGEGYYLVLPLLGPSSTRDVWGVAADSAIDPVSQLNPDTHRYAAVGLRTVDFRADYFRVERALADNGIDKYSFIRESYLQRRRNLVYDGNPPKTKIDFDFKVE